MTRHWLQQEERGSPFALRLIRWIALYIGRSVARTLLYPISIYFFMAARPQRRASYDYLTRIMSKKPSFIHVINHIHAFSATILDRVYFLTDQYEKFDIQIIDNSPLHEFVRDKKGCILLGSHLGSFEIMRTLAVGRNKIPLKVLMYKDHNESITKVFDALNPSTLATVINLGSPQSLLEVNDCLRQGYVVGMLGDRVAESDKVISCDFLGSDTTFPKGPALLATALKVPVILFYGLYCGGNRYELHFELLTETIDVDRQNRAKEIQRFMQKYVSRIEHYAYYAPYNWFNFYDFWGSSSA